MQDHDDEKENPSLIPATFSFCLYAGDVNILTPFRKY